MYICMTISLPLYTGGINQWIWEDKSIRNIRVGREMKPSPLAHDVI